MSITAEFISPIPKMRYVDANGNALTGGQLFVYEGGTTTKATTYTDSTGMTANTNPIILNTRGECDCWIPVETTFKFVLSPSTDTDPPTNPIWTVDNVSTTDRQFGSIATIASATTTDLGSKPSNLLQVTGITTISSFGSSAETQNPIYILVFSGVLTLTNNDTSMILPGGTNITTAAGSMAIAQYLGSGNWQVLSYSSSGNNSSNTPTVTLASAGTSGTQVANSSASTSVLPSASKHTLSANALAVGSVLLLRGMCALSNIAAAPGTLTMTVAFGATVVFNSGAMKLSPASTATNPFWFEINLTAYTIGSGTSATLMGQALLEPTYNGETLIVPSGSPVVGAGFDSTVSNVIDVLFQFSVANAGNTIQLFQYTIEGLP